MRSLGIILIVLLQLRALACLLRGITHDAFSRMTTVRWGSGIGVYGDGVAR